jgi:hypothetical protein
MEEILMELFKDTYKVEASFRKGKVCSFLNDLVVLCAKHKVSIVTIDEDETMVEFYNWDGFFKLEVDSEGASLYWPRIETDIVVRRNNEQRKSKEDC